MDNVSLYEYQPSFILGFHGCDREVGMRILSSPEEHLVRSEKKYDWLGHGVYFWEGNVIRALEWARARKVKDPFVLGAIIDLRCCLDLFDRSAALQLEKAHEALVATSELSNTEMPVNVGTTPDKLGRALDCSVFEVLHQLRKDEGKQSYDSVRGAFLEGDTIYPGAGFKSHTHIQICVREAKSACIKGYFKPIGLEKLIAATKNS